MFSLCHVTEGCQAFSSPNMGPQAFRPRKSLTGASCFGRIRRPSPKPFHFRAVCARDRIGQGFSYRALYFDARSRANAGLRGRASRRTRPRWRPLSAALRSPFAAGRDPGAEGRSISGSGGADHGALRRRGFRFRRNEVADRGRLRRLPSRRGRAACAARRQPVRARTFPRTDAGVQGFRHAMAGSGDKSRFATSAARERRLSGRPRATPARRRSRLSPSSPRSKCSSSIRTAGCRTCSAGR